MLFFGLVFFRDYKLAQCVKEGYEAQVVFVVQMSDVLYFTPNNKMHPAFGEALVAAKQAGVKIFAIDCVVAYAVP